MGRDIILTVIKYLNFLECRNDGKWQGTWEEGDERLLPPIVISGKIGKTKAHKLGQKQEILLVTASLTFKTKEKFTSVRF